MEMPVIDRPVFEKVFGVRRRRAIQLLHFFGGYQTGRTFLVDRLALIGQLEALLDGAEFVREKRRRQRLWEALEKGRLHGAAARVRIPVKPDVQDRRLSDLPEGIQLQSGSLRVDFCKVEDLLAKLFELSKAAANDFEAFRDAAEGR
jgi:hypothetical protein